MKVIKALMEGLVSKNSTFRYEIGKTYEIPKKVADNCGIGFLAAPDTDISKTIEYYIPNNDVVYVIAEVNEEDIIEQTKDRIVTKKITIIEELPQDFDLLATFDQTGKWITKIGVQWSTFDYEKGFKALIKADKTGEWVCEAGALWQNFDYERGLDALIKIDKTGEWICKTGVYSKEFDYQKWEQFNYEKGFEALIKVDKIGKWIIQAGLTWKVFDYTRAFLTLAEIDNSGTLVKNAEEQWRQAHVLPRIAKFL